MEKIKKIKPKVALSKNHCHFPLFTPATKRIEKHTLPSGVDVTGIGYHNKEGELQYVIGFGNFLPAGKKMTPLSNFDGQILLGLLAQLQKENNQSESKEINYTLKIKSFYRLLKMIGISNHLPSNYQRARESLFKIENTRLIFSKSFYDPEKGAVHSGLKTFSIFHSLNIRSTSYDSGEGDDCSIEVTFSKDWYVMHSSYFLLNELEWVKKLSEVEYTLACLLEAWGDTKIHKGDSFIRDFKTLCLKIGYKEAPTYDLKRQISNAIKNINKKCGRDYHHDFNKKNIVIMAKKARVMKRVRSEAGLDF